MEKNTSTRAGFTLVELVVVIAILGILAGIAYVGYGGYIEYARRAGDEDIISAANAAFASACEEQGIDRTTLPTGGANLKGDAKGTTIKGVGSVTGVNDIILFNKLFEDYYADNDDNTLKYYTTYQIQFDDEEDMFIFNENAYADYGKTFKDSNFDVKSLSTPVKSLTGMIEKLFNRNRHKPGTEDYEKDMKLLEKLEGAKTLDAKIEAVGEAFTLSGLSIDNDALKKGLLDLGLTDSSEYTEVINGIIMCAAQQTVNGNAEKLADGVLNRDWNMIDDGNGLGAFPLTVAKLTGYYNYLTKNKINDPEAQKYINYYNSLFNDSYGVSGTKLFSELSTLGYTAQKNGHWNDYIKQDESGKSQAEKDMDGYLAALKLLCANSDKVDLTQLDAIGTGEFADYINSLLDTGS